MNKNLSTTLLKCLTCNENIALSAKNCPKCGANDPFLFKQAKITIPTPTFSRPSKDSPFNVNADYFDFCWPFPLALIIGGTGIIDTSGYKSWLLLLFCLIICIWLLITYVNQQNAWSSFQDDFCSKHNIKYIGELEDEYLFYHQE